MVKCPKCKSRKGKRKCLAADTFIIGTIYRSIKRHTNGSREYLDFIQQHVGLRVGPGGMKVIKNFL